MGSSVINSFSLNNKKLQKPRKKIEKNKSELEPIKDLGEISMSDFDNEFDFVDAYSEDVVEDNSELLPENSTESAIDVAFVGVGGGGGIGFSRNGTDSGSRFAEITLTPNSFSKPQTLPAQVPSLNSRR